jgi:hypothetical protein
MKTSTLIDKYLPTYTFNEYHEIVINSPIEHVYYVAEDIDLSKSKIITFLFKIRGLPTKRMHLQNFIDDMGFTKLEESYPCERLIGFWARGKIEKIPSYEDFLNNSVSPWLKVVWNFQFEQLKDDKTKVSTETRVLCVAPIIKFTFGLYWFMIKPFSGLIRKRMLNIIKDDSEAAK